MKVPVHVITVESPDSKQPVSWIETDKTEVKHNLLDNYAEDDQEFLDYLVKMDPLIEVDFLHEMPLDQLIQRLESFYSLTIQHYEQEIEVALPKVDPTTHVEAVARRLWSHFHPVNTTDVWDEVNAVEKQAFKQNIVGTLYATLEALTEQGVIGGISRG